VPGLGHTRVPSRLLPITCLALAALASFALSRVRWRYGALVAAVLVAADLRVDTYDPLVADEDNAVYAALRQRTGGRLLERPVHLPEAQAGSVYVYYSMQAPRERPLGYSTTAPAEADDAALDLRAGRRLEELGVRWIVAFDRGRPQRLIARR
jgi:hypothetical protein